MLILVPLAAWASITTSSWAVILLVLVAPFALAAEMAYRNLGHVATRDLVVATHGTYERVTELLPVAKTQSVTLASSPFQRRSGLATLHIEVASNARPTQPRPQPCASASASALRLRT